MKLLNLTKFINYYKLMMCQALKLIKKLDMVENTR